MDWMCMGVYVYVDVRICMDVWLCMRDNNDVHNHVYSFPTVVN